MSQPNPGSGFDDVPAEHLWSQHPWRVEYENDTGPNDEGFREFWIVGNGNISFEADTEEAANWLRDTLNAKHPSPEPPTPGKAEVGGELARYRTTMVMAQFFGSKTKTAMQEHPTGDWTPYAPAAEALRVAQTAMVELRESRDTALNMLRVAREEVAELRRVNAALRQAGMEQFNEFRAEAARKDELLREMTELKEFAANQVAEREREMQAVEEMLSTMIDASVGASYHHIGDGDGIPEEEAEKIRQWAKARYERTIAKEAKS